MFLKLFVANHCSLLGIRYDRCPSSVKSGYKNLLHSQLFFQNYIFTHENINIAVAWYIPI